MKRYLVVVLALCLMVAVSMLYKQSRLNALLGFYEPSPSRAREPVLYLFGFFSTDSCMPCGELIGVLNRLPGDFQVIGIVPQGEAAQVEQIKEQYQIKFPIHNVKKYRRYKPLINPSIIGTSSKGRVLFVLPCATLQPDEITSFLMGFQMKLAPYLANESS